MLMSCNCKNEHTKGYTCCKCDCHSRQELGIEQEEKEK